MEPPLVIDNPQPRKPPSPAKVYLLFFVALAIIEASASYLIFSYRKSLQQVSFSNAVTTVSELTKSLDTISINTRATPTVPQSPTPFPTLVHPPSVTPAPSSTPVSGPPKNGYSRITQKTDRGNFTIDVASIKMLPRIAMIVDSANDTDCTNNCPVKPLGEYVQSHGGFAGINGTYFCPPDYPECGTKLNSYDFPIYNTRIDNWINGKNIYWNDRALVYKDFVGMHFYRRAKDAWRLVYTNVDVEAAVVNAPGLLDNGVVIVNQYPLTDKQKARGVKAGIGFNTAVTFLVVAQNADMEDLAAILKSIGATYALNLDSGGSAALWFGGYMVGPGRNLPNAIIFAIE